MAPTDAERMLPSVPVALRSRSENIHSPTKEPITPINKFPQNPNPSPLVIFPAIHPAINPTKIVPSMLSNPPSHKNPRILINHSFLEFIVQLKFRNRNK